MVDKIATIVSDTQPKFEERTNITHVRNCVVLVVLLPVVALAGNVEDQDD